MQPHASQHARDALWVFCEGESGGCAGAQHSRHCTPLSPVWRGGRDACITHGRRGALRCTDEFVSFWSGAHWTGKAPASAEGAGGALREQPACGANTSTRAATSTWMYGKYGWMVACSRTGGQRRHPGPLARQAEGWVDLHRDDALLSVRHQHAVQGIAPPAGSAPSAQRLHSQASAACSAWLALAMTGWQAPAQTDLPHITARSSTVGWRRTAIRQPLDIRAGAAGIGGRGSARALQQLRV